MDTEKKIPKIVKRNLDIEHIMHASCQYGLHGYGQENYKKIFSALITTDVHGCGEQFASAIEYLNYYEAIDCGICLGDIQPGNYAQENEWFVNCVQQSQKPFLSVLGNHDLGNSTSATISATQKMAFERFILPVADKIGVKGLDKPYYLRKFDAYKIAVLVLNTYEAPEDLNEDGDFILHRGYEAFSKAQVDFIVKALAEVPTDYHLIVAMHSFPYKVELTDSVWTQLGAKVAGANGNNYEGDLLPDILNAWINGEEFQAEYLPKKEGVLPTLSVSCDFTARGKGEFVGYFIGHHHRDMLGSCQKYPGQKIVYFASTAMDTWQNANCDLARAENTKAEDLLTVVSVHTEKKEVRLVRVGSNITNTLVDRTFIAIPY